MKLVGPAQGSILDLVQNDPRTDRVQLHFGDNGLELEVFDSFGDHPATPFEEVARATIPVSAQGPSIAPGIWGHVAVTVRGNQPGQIDMTLDGMQHGVEVHGRSTTTRALAEGDTVIQVESTEGFPPVGVARVGSEFVEYTLRGENELFCRFNASGPMAGFGGRLARSQRERDRDVGSIPPGLALGLLRGGHPVGTLVEHYGYSIPLRQDIPSGQGTLTSEVGPFRVARVTDVGDTGSTDAILPEGAIGLNSLQGLEKDNLGPLVLALADNPTSDEDGAQVMGGFHASGGYALLLQGWGGTQFGSGLLTAAPNGTPIGGVEVIRYSGKNGNELLIARRAAHDELNVNFLDQARAFIIDYGGIVDTNGVEANDVMTRSVYCIPISIPVTNASIFPPSSGPPRMVQLTHPGQGELTEWVRYDRAQSSFQQLVRLDERMVNALSLLLGTGGLAQLQSQLPGGVGGGGGGGGGGGMLAPGSGFGPTAGGAMGTGPLEPNNAPYDQVPPLNGSGSGQASPSQTLGQGSGGASSNVWTPVLGTETDTTFALSRAALDIMEFRGVADTFDQTHSAGTVVVPVFEVEGRYGHLAGAQDAVWIDGGSLSPGGVQTSVVHRAYVMPLSRLQRTFEHEMVDGAASAATEAILPLIPVPPGAGPPHYVALGAGLPGPISLPTSPLPGEDQRILPRMVKFPSGERPRSATQVALGTEAISTAQSGGASAPVVIDELLFGTANHGDGLIAGFQQGSNAGAGLILAEDIGPADPGLLVRSALYAARGVVPGTTQTIRVLEQANGLARIGEEIVCYVETEANSGTVVLAQFGRGLLGTQANPHCAGTVMHPLDNIPATVLAGDLNAEDELLGVVSSVNFPDQGTVLVGQEIIHYTRKQGGQLWMPRASLIPGAQDGGGIALFRGRFGTQAADHPAGTPVILFPFRYWDRWQAGADAPEMAFLELRVEQNSSLFDGAFFEQDSGGLAAVRLGAILRADDNMPWDMDPEETPGMWLLNQGAPEGEQAWPLGAWGDALEARFFVDYEPGALNIETGSSHAWKYSPRLLRFAVSYNAPSQTLRSVDR